MTVATLALDNARLYQREHHIAETLQEAILSPPDPVDGLEIAYLYRPASSAANVGGDFYEVVAVENDRIGVMVGDVSGKGIEAARFTTLMKNGARAFLLEGDDPHCVLERLNSLAWRSTPVERFATAFLGVLDVSAGSLRYAGAGHPSALVLGPGGVQTLPSSAGLLGAWDVLHFESATYRLGHDDVLVMYTDGVTEAHRHGELFGEERLIGALEALSGTSVDELPQALLDAVLEFSEGELRDDVVILCLARKR
jgi:serine phosphatase RsbU (regulator of sigma subunit)